jgi:predicted phosphodiesterase
MSPKIYYASDLHPEFEDETFLKMYEGKEYLDSYLVLAGDICPYNCKGRFKAFFEYIQKKFKRVIYVAGNHEYYKKTLDDDKIRELIDSFDNVYFLQDSYVP